MKRHLLAVAMCVAASAAFALSSQAASASVDSHRGPLTTKPPPKPKEYEVTQSYPGTTEVLQRRLQLYAKTHTWDFAEEGNSGTYGIAGKEIELTEQPYGPCVFVGAKGKKGIVYQGIWECQRGLYEEPLVGTWVARKVPLPG